jgi:hypothetical protein
MLVAFGVRPGGVAPAGLITSALWRPSSPQLRRHPPIDASVHGGAVLHAFWWTLDLLDATAK